MMLKSSMRKHDQIRLRHMLDAAREARSFARDRPHQALDRDRQLVLALVKDIEIVGEAATGISMPTRQASQQIPWERIVGMRNRLVHVYFDINLDVVWSTVQEDLPGLIAQLELAISDPSEPPAVLK